MKTLLLFSLASITAFGQVVKVPPRNIVPMEVQMRAKDATQTMVDKTLRGDFAAVVERTYPEYLKFRAREKRRSVPQIKADMVNNLKKIGQGGVVLNAMITLKPQSAFEVDYGVEKQVVNGEEVQVGVYRKWMVFVPTVVDISAMDHDLNPPRMRTFRKWDFEVVIADKEQENWTFITGSSANAMELRKYFKFLPPNDRDLHFPERKIEEIGKK